jgi:hypothetical protein
MIKEFKTLEEKNLFEENRINYYLERVTVSAWKCYKYLFIDYFTPSGRKMRKLYDNYDGGYYRDKKGYIHIDMIGLIPLDNLSDGEVIIEDPTNDVYCKCHNSLVKIDS